MFSKIMSAFLLLVVLSQIVGCAPRTVIVREYRSRPRPVVQQTTPGGFHGAFEISVFNRATAQLVLTNRSNRGFAIQSKDRGSFEINAVQMASFESYVCEKKPNIGLFAIMTSASPLTLECVVFAVDLDHPKDVKEVSREKLAGPTDVEHRLEYLQKNY